MTLTTRRHFIHQTVIGATAVFGQPLRMFAGVPTFKAREQHTASLDAAVVKKLANEIAGHVITPESPDFEPSRVLLTAHLIGVLH
jgi:hypothetical protein